MKTFLAGLILCIVLSGCGKSSNDNVNSPYFLQTLISNVQYSTSSVATFVLSNQQGCATNKNYTVTNIGQINVDAYYLDCYIKHYANNIDFASTKAGSHRIYDAGVLLSNPACNCDLIIGLIDNSIPNLYSNTVLQPTNIVNNITSIVKIDSAAAYVKYEIKGNFSCTFKNTNNTVIPVTGQFDVPIKVSK